MLDWRFRETACSLHRFCHRNHVRFEQGRRVNIAFTKPIFSQNHLIKEFALTLRSYQIAPNSPSRVKPSELESSIANALYDLESSVGDMRSALRPLQFVSAREVRSKKRAKLRGYILCLMRRSRSGNNDRLRLYIQRRWTFIAPRADTVSLGRSWSWQKSNRHLCSRPSPPWLSQGPATVRNLSSRRTFSLSLTHLPLDVINQHALIPSPLQPNSRTRKEIL